MNPIPSSTFFSAPPDWGWLIVFYFFFGGLAGGCYFLAALVDLLGRPEDRPLARLGYYIAFPCIVLSGILLTVDLYRPERFWHMLIQSNTFRPMFKPWSPMSLGSWALLIFGMFSLISFIAALVEDDRLSWRQGLALRPPAGPGIFISVIGGLLGFYVAGYTGVLLAVTNQPIWSDTPLIGMLFVVSAASISGALMVLLADRWGWRMAGVAALHRLDLWVVALELIVLLAFIVSLGPVFRAWLNVWGLLLLAAIVVGMLAPLTLYWRHRGMSPGDMVMSAILVLAGGFLLRLVIIFSTTAGV